MKGFAISTTAVVILIIAIVLLGTMVYFIMFQTTSSMSQADADRIFYGQCGEYRTYDCAWSVTRMQGFDDFLKACRFLFGPEREDFSCLYAMCQSCKELDLVDVKCEGMCRICDGHDYASIQYKDCCANYKSTCGFGCDICSTPQN